MTRKILILLKQSGVKAIAVIKKFFNKLSIQISGVIILFACLGVLVFVLFYINKDIFFNLAKDSKIIEKDTQEFAINIENQIIDQNISIYDSNKMKKIIGKSDIYDVFIFDLANEQMLAGTYASMLNNTLVGYTLYDTDSIYNSEGYTTTIDLKDGTIELYVYSYALAKLVIPYIIGTLLISLSVFLIPVFLFIRRKVKNIERLKDEVIIMSQGNLEHTINFNSNDEIEELSFQINELRKTLKENLIANEANQKASYELVTALAHDIRTPLTSLMGYLDIIRLKRYKNDQQYDTYLNNSIDKVNQINELANKMFEYFLVFSKEQDTELSLLSLNSIYEYFDENIEQIKQLGFTVVEEIEHNNANILGNMNLIKRIINNLFSNISKYAMISEPIYLKLKIDQNKDCVIIKMKNKIKVITNQIESNQIGLKSVKQILKIHQGELMINNDDNNFEVIITIPLAK